MRYRLCTLLIVLALGPPVLAGVLILASMLVAQYQRTEAWEDVGGPGEIESFEPITCVLDPNEP